MLVGATIAGPELDLGAVGDRAAAADVPDLVLPGGVAVEHGTVAATALELPLLVVPLVAAGPLWTAVPLLVPQPLASTHCPVASLTALYQELPPGDGRHGGVSLADQLEGLLRAAVAGSDLGLDAV